MSEQMFLRDDIIDFSNRLDNEGYNVKAYRKRKSQSKKLSVLATTTNDADQSQDMNLINQINKSLEKTNFNFDKVSERRISMTAALKKRSDVTEELRQQNRSINMKTQLTSHKKQLSIGARDSSTAKIQFPNTASQRSRRVSVMGQSVDGLENITENNLTDRPPSSVNAKTHQTYQSQNAGEKYRELQKRYHKSGPINEKAVENWLNQILMEYANGEQFDKSIENAALKKMSIDRNSLLSQGIKPEHVSRVYRSMFVYSIGFNNLLKELSGKNDHFKKTVWKVYAILLEFCSEGSFETMIGEIERDKAKKVESLREEIQKRQLIIENNDEANEEKNAKIFKELKLLREENNNLQTEKNVLLEDFKEAEQSFNQEVSLRLKFENKINEIHGIHHELATKHARLYEDHQLVLSDFKLMEQAHKKLNEQHLILRDKTERTESELELLREESLSDKELLAKYEEMRSTYEKAEIEMKNSKEELQNVIKEKLRRISQLEMEMKNGEIMLSLSKSSASELESQYLESLGANKRLQATINEQVDQLNELFTDRNNFNQKHMGYVAEIEFLKSKDSESQVSIRRLRGELKQKEQAIESLTLDNATLDKKLEYSTQNLKDCHENIENMKRTKNIYEEELAYLKKRSELHGELIRGKEATLDSLTEQNSRLTKENEELLTLNKTLDSKTTVLTQRLRSEEEINRKKYEKVKAERDELLNSKTDYDGVLKEKIEELEKYIDLYEKEQLNLKNERFERVNLDLRYKQSLQVMEKENEHIRKLNITISENYEEIEEWKRKYRNFEYVLKEREHLHQVETKELSGHLEVARREVNRKKLFVSPMLLEDMKGQLQRAIENIVSLRGSLSHSEKKFTELQLSARAEKELLIQKSLKQIEGLSGNYKKQFEEKNYELEFEKQKNKHLQEKVQSLQRHLESKPEGEDSLKKMKQKQKKYLQTIKEKSTEIDNLLKQLENSHDSNNTLIKRITEIEEVVSSKNAKITELEQELTKLGQIKSAVSSSNPQSGLNSNLSRHRDTPSSRFDDYDDNLPAMNQERASDGKQEQYLGSHQNGNNRKETLPRSRAASGKSKASVNKNDPIEDSSQQGDKRQRKNRSGNKQKLVNPVWRNDFSKKLKNAFNYYQK